MLLSREHALLKLHLGVIVEVEDCVWGGVSGEVGGGALTSVHFADVWSFVVDDFVSRAISVHQSGEGEEVQPEDRRFTLDT